MSTFLIAVRSIHFISVLVLWGEFVFLIGLARPVLRSAPGAMLSEQRELHRHLVLVSSWSLALAFVSGAVWLGIEAVLMSGEGFERALTREIVGTVLNETAFGLVWTIRFGFAAALGGLLFALARSSQHGRAGQIVSTSGALCAGCLLGSIAWAGHAAVERGAAHYIHLFADAAHLLAAGAWFGGLFPLAFVLNRAQQVADPERLRLAAQMTRRFSGLGLLSVSVLILSGFTNSLYTVGSMTALFGTDYGWWLLSKLMLFGAVLALAGMNRLQLSPRLLAPSGVVSETRTPPALRWLWRSVVCEMALGCAILTIVGVLGVTPPGSHSGHLVHPGGALNPERTSPPSTSEAHSH